MPRRPICLLFSLLLLVATGYSQKGANPVRKNLLNYLDDSGKSHKVRNERDWDRRRLQILEAMQQVMGPLPDASGKVPPDMKVMGRKDSAGVTFLKISFVSEKNDRVPAWLLVPSDLQSRVPGILCLHQTIEIGKAEPAGLGGNPNLHYALELAQRGYVTLSPDYPNFGEYAFDPYGNGYVSTTMKAIRNHMAAVDLLQSLTDVDPGRIGCIGHSLGGHNSLFLAAFDTRIKAVVTSCGFTSFSKYYGGDLTGWSHMGYMPRIAGVYGKDPARMPFDFPEILGAIAPRAVFINAPQKDSNFEVSGVYDCVDAAKRVYTLLNAPGKITVTSPDAPHDFPPAEREAAYRFLDHELSKSIK